MSNPEALVQSLIEREKGGAIDNLARARLAAGMQDASKLYGQSGQTLNEIIAGYQKRLDDVQDALDWFKEGGTP